MAFILSQQIFIRFAHKSEESSVEVVWLNTLMECYFDETSQWSENMGHCMVEVLCC